MRQSKRPLTNKIKIKWIYETQKDLFKTFQQIWKHSNQLKLEFSGVVNPDQASVIIENIGNYQQVKSNNHRVGFHTHPTFPAGSKLQEEDRYTPPSGADVVDIFRKDRKVEYVLTEKGIWKINKLQNPPEDLLDVLKLYYQVLKIHFINDISPFEDPNFTAYYIVEYLRWANQIDFKTIFNFIESQKSRNDAYLDYINHQLTKYMGQSGISIDLLQKGKKIDGKRYLEMNFLPYTPQDDLALKQRLAREYQRKGKSDYQIKRIFNQPFKNL